MTSGSSLTITAGAGMSRRRELFARVAKAHSTGGLNSHPAPGSDGGHRSGRRHGPHSLSHSGTWGCAPLWYGPRLRPAFVAQVLAQALRPERCDPRTALAAYDETGARMLPRAFNRSI